jgi:N-acylneuraminate cytidylyltransferase
MKEFFRPNVRSTRSQDFPQQFRLNGAVYVYRVSRLIAQGHVEMDDNTRAYVMPVQYSVDIDHPNDLQLAEFLMKQARTNEA